MWNKKHKRLDIELRAPQKRKSFFEKKQETVNLIFGRIIFRLLILVFLAAVLYTLFFSPFLEIKEININGVSELNYQDIQQKINDSLNEKYFRFIPKKNLILVRPRNIENKLLEDFKKISNVEVKKLFPDGINLKITERKEYLLWCSAGPCYIIDEKGYAYTGADFESEELKQNHLINISDTSGKPVIIGEKVLKEDYINFVTSLAGMLERDAGINIIGEYQTQSRIADEVKVKTDEGWEILFSTSLPAENSIRTLVTFLEKEIGQNKRIILEYIDLRAENKVYYKLKNQDEQDNEEQKNEQFQIDQ